MCAQCGPSSIKILGSFEADGLRDSGSGVGAEGRVGVGSVGSGQQFCGEHTSEGGRGEWKTVCVHDGGD